VRHAGTRHAMLYGRPRRPLASVLAEHMESPGTVGFTKRELRRRFAALDSLVVDQVATSYDYRVAGPVSRLTGRHLS
jgi:hypothetical protein